MSISFFDAADVERFLPFDRAMDALEEALRGDANGVAINPEDDGPRLFSDAPDGEFLLMPAQGPTYSGVKALTVAPNNPERGFEKIQGLYILYSSDTLTPVAVLEGASLTAIRTPAVTLSAVRQLANLAPEGSEIPAAPRVLIFGAGVQALSHARAAALVFPGASFDIVGRRPERIADLITALSEAQETAGLTVRDRTSEADQAVREADVIICVTSASDPLFDGNLVQNHAIVAAAGTHGLERREVDDALIGRADLFVEGRGSAQRENGNFATALSADDWQANPPKNLQDLAQGNATRTPGKPAFYSGVGMSWEDLVCASAIATTEIEGDS
ncbi:ornithine cyclodeaminase family protein [Leucobacter denitrificans]|uniref:Ornithine cyclodeaminase family protein n=1 Tax=Leucobacter denitrificans TaxID=683042 RepID=A0A7G9S3M8_9MICO|nr:ornithine cyclodeaminase family protein [Leucobacter denitrificans]QNN62453.1 ornithine cyclodeaminase family protein [Leucobacter denitrificans]